MDIYNKILFLWEKKLYDCLGNSTSPRSVKSIELLAGSIGLIEELPTNVEYGKFSVYISPGNNLFLHCSEKMLRNSQKLEMIMFQILLNHTMTKDDVSIYNFYLKLMDKVKDGQINRAQFEHEIHGLKIEAGQTFNSILLMDNLSTLHNIILDEFQHVELRIIDTINSMIKLMTSENMKRKFEDGTEVRSFSLYSDNAAFCIQDSIKAIYKTLDVLAKWLFYMKNYKEKKNKFQMLYFDDTENLVNQWCDCGEKATAKLLIEKLKPLTSIRNEITHNHSLNHTRQHVFVGKGTKCVDNAKLLYSDLLFWDYEGGGISRSNNRIGFFNDNKNALTETQYFWSLSIKLLDICMSYYYKSLINDATEIGLKEILVWSGFPYELIPVDIDYLKNGYLNVFEQAIQVLESLKCTFNLALCSLNVGISKTNYQCDKFCATSNYLALFLAL